MNSKVIRVCIAAVIAVAAGAIGFMVGKELGSINIELVQENPEDENDYLLN